MDIFSYLLYDLFIMADREEEESQRLVSLIEKKAAEKARKWSG